MPYIIHIHIHYLEYPLLFIRSFCYRKVVEISPFPKNKKTSPIWRCLFVKVSLYHHHANILSVNFKNLDQLKF